MPGDGFDIQPFFPAPDLQPRPESMRQIPDAARRKFVDSFLPEFAKGADTLQIRAAVPPFEPVVINFRRTGTAGVFSLHRVVPPAMQPALQSLCILLSGKDPAADAQAIAAAKNWKDDAGRPLPTPPAVFAQIQTARPVLVLIAGTVSAATDGGLQFVAETFAEGFFRSVGV